MQSTQTQRKIRHRIRKAMAEKGMTQTALAEQAGLNQADISRYVNGREPGVTKALKVAEALSMSVENIWGGFTK